jgi:hypothetical protein
MLRRSLTSSQDDREAKSSFVFAGRRDLNMVVTKENELSNEPLPNDQQV